MQIEEVLVVDDDPAVRDSLGGPLERAGCEVTWAASASGGCEGLLDGKSCDLVFIASHLTNSDKCAALARYLTAHPRTAVVVLGGPGQSDNAPEALQHSVFAQLLKPVLPGQIQALLGKAAEYRALAEENCYHRQTDLRGDSETGDLIGRSDPMREVLRLVDKFSGGSGPVLIAGEEGAGKELVARAIRRRSPRADKPFLRVQCAALPEMLLENELFGQERVTLTGAATRRPGRLELADTGTLLLVEIGASSLHVQEKLWRLLETGACTRAGGTRTLRLDVRLFCTTDRDLKKASCEGRFHAGLSSRLEPARLIVPPLRDRANDVPLLAEYFLRRHAERRGRPSPALGSEARAALCAYDWPGNVRELEHAVERAVSLCANGMLTPAHLGLAQGLPAARPAAAPDSVNAVPGSAAAGPWDANTVSRLAEVERRVILRTMQETKGNRTRAAGILGISVRTLYTKLKEYESTDAVLPQARSA